MNKLIASSFILILLSSCFKQIDKDKAEVASAPSLQIFEEKARARGLFSKETFRNEQWWEAFSDDQLTNLIKKAIQNSPTLLEAEARVVNAQANAKSIRSNLFPQLHAHAEDNWEYLSKYGFIRNFYPLPPGFTVPAKLNEIDLTLNFSYEVDFFGKNRKELSEALGLAIASEMEKKQATLILCSNVAFSYFELQMHLSQKALYEKWYTSAEKLAKFFQLRFEAGLDNLSAPLQQEQSVAAIKQKIIESEKEIEIDLLFLKELLGEGPESPLHLERNDTLFLKSFPIPEQIELNLLSQRPDLMAQIWKVEAAKYGIEVAKTEFYPNVNLKAFAGFSSLSFADLFKWASRTGGLNPAIKLPLFTGGQLRANLSSKLALFNQNVQNYNALLLQAAKEVAGEITTILALEEQIQIQTKIVKREKELFSLASNRFEIGIDNQSKVLSSLEMLISQEINDLLLKESKILSTVRLIKFLGGGMSSSPLPAP